MSRNSTGNDGLAEEKRYPRPVSRDECIFCSLTDEGTITREELYGAGTVHGDWFDIDLAIEKLDDRLDAKVEYRTLDQHLQHHKPDEQA